jgi:hypothetical protein
MKKIIFLIILLPICLSANFIGMNNGARALAMGNAYIALSDEPTAIFFNPAGLARTNQFYLSASHQNLFGLTDLSNDMVAISFPTPLFRTGIAVQQINLLNTYAEQIFYLSTAGIIRLQNIPIRLGASLKYESAKSVNYENAANPTNLDVDFGILVDFTENIFWGFSAKNLLEPEFQFISENEKLERKFSAGICYNWRNSVNFLADYVRQKNESQWNFGSEMWFYDVFAARLGMCGDKLTAGFGLNTNSWSVDGAVFAHEQLGSTYRISLSLKFGGKK